METAKLTAERVESVFMNSLFADGEDTSQHVEVNGVMARVGFHPERLKGHEPEIVEMLEELPENFRIENGGGWSFLQACQDRHGNQWTGFHQAMDQLFMLGMGIGKVKMLVPRAMWPMLPGGMPYFGIDFTGNFRKASHQVDKPTVDKVIELSKGNPGAVRVLTEMIRDNNAEELFPILEEYSLKGPDIWVLYKDCCDYDQAKLKQLLTSAADLETLARG
jgi:hypothetical protein